MPDINLHVIKLNSDEAEKFRSLICRYYDMIQYKHKTLDGEITYYDLDLYPKGSLPKQTE